MSLIQGLRCCRPHSVLQAVRSQKYSVQADPEIVIPKRIHRGPTDILRALANTVNTDYTAPQYKYHDDPYLIPMSNYAKRSYALSQESGKKAAKWILQEHADLFQHRVADPPIEVFYPKNVYTEESEVELEDLKNAIDHMEVSDSILVFNLLKQKNVDLPREVLQDLLELICFYNEADKEEENLIEERWYKQGIADRSTQRKTWKDNNIAESIFQSLDPPDSKSYSAIISGMTSHGQLEVAWRYFEQAKSQGVTLSSGVYNGLIRNAIFVKEDCEARWALIMELLKELNDNKVLPNVGTLNSVMEALADMANYTATREIALRVMADFKRININPSLATYYHLLKLFCRDKSRPNSILANIINVLEHQELSIVDAKDTFFFTQAMEICCKQLSDLELADRIDRLLHTGNNYNLIGDSIKESIYYRNYFLLKCDHETLDDFFIFYDKLVPNIYVPEPLVTEVILKAIDMNGANHLYSRIWSDIVLFDQNGREKIIKCDPGKYVQESVRRFELKGSMLGHMMSVLLNAGRFEKSCEILKKLDKDQQTVLGVPDIRSLHSFIDASLERNDATRAMWCLQYCYDAGFEETSEIGLKIYEKLQLSESQLSRLTSIVGEDALQKH
ncbi:protein PTCD3 homolog, mitochondrial [Nilaparvata lugens]|uniref:protein PTCD3 homolog, mitochondrial n=1 Tax=Nilaparvata lugens TaxID=108931 RepID=UPI00193CD9AF|nr:protein PTCD3 homolog, mitochondrial [Nilaparvata lugens]